MDGVKEESEEFEHHTHFDEHSLTLGLGLPYSNAINSVGFNFRMYFNLEEHICFGPEYSYFKTDEYEIVDFDLIGHYIFETPVVGIYSLIGGNYTVETDLSELEEETEEGFGLIYGIGIHRNVKDFTFFAEYTRVEFGLDDQLISTGIMFTIE